jgi:hypothetical protein
MHLNFQAVIKQFSGTGFERSDSVVIDEVELQQHQRLEKLYSSTRSGRVRKGNLHRSILCMAESQNLKLQSHICSRFKALCRTGHHSQLTFSSLDRLFLS